MRHVTDPARLAVCLVLGAACTACLAKERQKVTVSYVVAPKAPLPEGLKAVAVIDSGVTTAGVQQDDRERKWSTIAADMVEAMLQNGSLYGSPLAVANRRETKKVLQEQDLKLAGLVDGATAHRVGKLLDVQGLVASRITIKIDIQKGTKSTIDWMSVMGGVVDQLTQTRQQNNPPPPRPQPRVYRDPRYTNDPRYSYSHDPRYGDRRYVIQRRVDPRTGRVYETRVPQKQPYVVTPGPTPAPGQPAVSRSTRTRQGYGGMSLATKDVQEISRHLTVQCVFGLIDAATGQVLVQYAPPPYQKKDEGSPDFFFGSNIDESDLDPVDQFIGELVERATQEFVSLIVPARIDVSYEIIGRHDEGEAGVRALRADEYSAALKHFESWHRKYDDEPEALFATGLTFELTGDFERALDCYRKAIASEDADEDRLPIYLNAKNRLTDHLPRILPPQPTVFIQTQPGQPVQPPMQGEPDIQPAENAAEPPSAPQ
ncbi:MAG TPA: tetratricopeptide repeat protein [Phycisphaerae bacterium]|nr:tetratricopeptide repeat protein [Phycisphaerae bacterium]